MALPYSNDEMGGAVGAQMASADTMLLGRRTYTVPLRLIESRTFSTGVMSLSYGPAEAK